MPTIEQSISMTPIHVFACLVLLQGAAVSGDLDKGAIHPSSVQAVAHIEEGDDADEAFNKADLDGDSHLDLPEFRTYYHHSSLVSRPPGHRMK